MSQLNALINNVAIKLHYRFLISFRINLKKRLIRSTREFISDNCQIILPSITLRLNHQPPDSRYDYTRASAFWFRNGYRLPAADVVNVYNTILDIRD